MAAKTVAGVAAELAELAARVAELEAWKAKVDRAIADHWALRKEISERNTAARLAELEAYAKVNRAKIDDLNISDEASGWKAWREQRKAQEVSARATEDE